MSEHEDAHDATGLELARSIARGLAGTRRTTKRPRKRIAEATFSGAHPDDRDPQLLDATIGRLVAEQGWSTDVRLHGVFSRWDAIVGRDVAQHCTPESFDRVYFVSGGSEAIEAALKLARQFFVEKGEPQRRHVIARRQSYHGNTLGALAVGGNQWRRKQFEPLLIEATHVSPCYAYRDRIAGEGDQAYGKQQFH